jgi:hypothetical protein
LWFSARADAVIELAAQLFVPTWAIGSEVLPPHFGLQDRTPTIA